MTETEKAWVAGLIDGEGSLSFNVFKPSPTRKIPGIRPLVRVGMTHYPTIMRLWKLAECGHIQVCELGHHLTMYHWTLRDRKACEFAKIIQPYLVTKREQCDVLVEYWARDRPRSGRRGITPEELAIRLEFVDRLLAARKTGASYDNQHRPDPPQEQPNTHVTRDCETCKKPFTSPRSSKRIYCNRVCFSIAKERTRDWVCPQCNKPFSAPYHETRKYCGHPCYVAARIGKPRKKIIVEGAVTPLLF